jgi:excisionase family DNA binding protein
MSIADCSSEGRGSRVNLFQQTVWAGCSSRLNIQLDIGRQSCYIYVAMKRHTTNEAAGKLGVHRVTLQRWIAGGRITAPEVQEVGVLRFRLWMAADIERVRKQIKRSEMRQ